MAFVMLDCPNCGGQMERGNNQYRCPYCGAEALYIVDAKINGDIDIITPEEFGKQLDESRKQFVVNINNEFKVMDVDTMVLNKKIQDATKLLAEKKYEEVLLTLQRVEDKWLSVVRLKYLASLMVSNEYELSMCYGYIDEYCGGILNEGLAWWRYDALGYYEYYKEILQLADEQTKNTYIEIAKLCRERYDTTEQVKEEIRKANELLDVELYDEAIAYTKEMCRKYPQYMHSWMYAVEAKLHKDENYNYDREMEIIKKCYGYSERCLTDEKYAFVFGGYLRAIIRERYSNSEQARNQTEECVKELEKVVAVKKKSALLWWGIIFCVGLSFSIKWIFGAAEVIWTDIVVGVFGSAAIVLLLSVFVFWLSYKEDKKEREKIVESAALAIEFVQNDKKRDASTLYDIDFCFRYWVEGVLKVFNEKERENNIKKLDKCFYWVNFWSIARDIGKMLIVGAIIAGYFIMS